MKFIAFTGLLLISCFILSVVIAVGVYAGIHTFIKNYIETLEVKKISKEE